MLQARTGAVGRIKLKINASMAFLSLYRQGAGIELSEEHGEGICKDGV